MNRSVSVEELKLQSSFESLCKTLSAKRFSDRWDKPLAYWALPNDRRLPLAYLGHTLQQIINMPFDQLASTPGIGLKKIESLVKLLVRATKDQPPAIPPHLAEPPEKAAKPSRVQGNGADFDPTVVSEALWEQLRETVRRHDLGSEKLGRLAPSLQELPTVIWHTPLEAYLEMTLSEIRRMKTHGEKRVRVIVEVFYSVHELLAHSRVGTHLGFRLIPKFVLPVERWVTQSLDRVIGVPKPDEVRSALTMPLLEQLQIDGGSTLARLAEGRLGIHGPPQSVRQQSRRMGVTRARIYQMLEDCSKVMLVRWPEGRCLLGALKKKFDLMAQPTDDLRLFRATVELFYPEKLELADLAIELAVD
jgi:hypothetical protein